MNVLNFIYEIVNLAFTVELAIVFVIGMGMGLQAIETTGSQFCLLTKITASLFLVWQVWPHQLVWLTALPQTSFLVFAGGLAGYSLKYACSQLIRSL